jgi:hypothetical protein
MINSEALRQLGWSPELIDAFEKSAQALEKDYPEIIETQGADSLSLFGNAGELDLIQEPVATQYVCYIRKTEVDI